MLNKVVNVSFVKHMPDKESGVNWKKISFILRSRTEEPANLLAAPAPGLFERGGGAARIYILDPQLQ